MFTKQRDRRRKRRLLRYLGDKKTATAVEDDLGHRIDQPIANVSVAGHDEQKVQTKSGFGSSNLSKESEAGDRSIARDDVCAILLVAATFGDIEDLHGAVDIGGDAETGNQELMRAGRVLWSDRPWRESEVARHG